jgi:hypothetical protein
MGSVVARSWLIVDAESAEWCSKQKKRVRRARVQFFVVSCLDRRVFARKGGGKEAGSAGSPEDEP